MMNVDVKRDDGASECLLVASSRLSRDLSKHLFSFEECILFFKGAIGFKLKF
jgi:hypothetical protein